METKEKEEIRQAVRESYGKVANNGFDVAEIIQTMSCCGDPNTSEETVKDSFCCDKPQVTPDQMSEIMGYSKEDLDSVPEGANLGLGCGNPDKGIIHKGHSPHFDVDEAALPIAVDVFTEAVRSYLSN